MKYRYLDLRRSPVRKNLELRHKMTMEVRRYLDSKGFLEIETPMLVGSTPEGARDFVQAFTHEPGSVLRPTPIATDIEAIAYGVWHGQVLPDCKVFPR